MSPLSSFEDFVDEVEISIIDFLDAMSDRDANRLYAEILDAEERLDALRDALTLLAAARPG